MTRCLLLASLTAAALGAPAPASAAVPDEPVIREIDIRPAAPVVGPSDSVRLVIDVVAKGVRGRQGVVVEVEPGPPPGPLLEDRRPPAEEEEEDWSGPGPAPFGEPDEIWTSEPKWGRAEPEGWETWRFLPDKRLNRFYPAGTWTVAVTARGAGGAEVTEYAAFELKRETRLTSVRAGHHGGGLRLSGRLKRLDPRGLAAFTPFGGQRVAIQWRRDPSAEWETVTGTTTDSGGRFSRTVGGRPGEWRAYFPGTRKYAADAARPRAS